MAQLARNLPIGAKLKDLDTVYNGAPIAWTVAAKNHQGYPNKSLTLVSEKSISIKAFDAKEPNNSLQDPKNYGDRSYEASNIRQWLNKSGTNWYTSQGLYDNPPSGSSVNENPYASEPGFLTGYSTNFINNVLNTRLSLVYNSAAGIKYVNDKIFLLSLTEVGLGDEKIGSPEGYALSLFNADNNRKSYLTQEAVDQSTYKNSSLINVNNSMAWWLRTPLLTAGRTLTVSADGLRNISPPFEGWNVGLKPAMNISDSLMVSDSPDSDGVYTILFNNAPSVTLSTTDGRTLYENNTYGISGNAKDTDSGDVVSVKYQINGGTIRAISTAISTGADIPFNKQLIFKSGKLFDGATEVTPTLAEGTQHLIKVWAEDDKGGKSAEQSRTFYVVPNRPASLTIDPISQQIDLVDDDKVTVSGNVSDPDGNTVSVKYKIANGSFTEVYNGTGGAFTFDVLLSHLKVGENILSIQATDSYGAITSKTLKITKAQNTQPLKEAVTRYKLTPPNGTAKGVLLWVEREVGDLVVDAEISMTTAGAPEDFKSMVKSSTAFVREGIEEDEFTFEHSAAVESIILKITMTRTSTASQQGITLISGVLS